MLENTKTVQMHSIKLSRHLIHKHVHRFCPLFIAMRLKLLAPSVGNSKVLEFFLEFLNLDALEKAKIDIII